MWLILQPLLVVITYFTGMLQVAAIYGLETLEKHLSLKVGQVIGLSTKYLTLLLIHTRHELLKEGEHSSRGHVMVLIYLWLSIMPVEK